MTRNKRRIEKLEKEVKMLKERFENMADFIIKQQEEKERKQEEPIYFG